MYYINLQVNDKNVCLSIQIAGFYYHQNLWKDQSVS